MSTDPEVKAELYALNLSNAVWRKSPLSQDNRDCLEYTDLPGGGTAIRDSKNPHLPALRFNAEEWAAFVGGAKQGLL
ncbi:DUF397 domain-containing protein [Kitasatospora sp. NBC_01287]|uniref:DUF397 domain-containing protein n=1 Tax=Kitasatospora sp. NBC_01287 TaxID=2903573 RepID=UPI002252CAB5|nr:DUF397 domain-containing protein [Kitasatospora sp. NBC_01287]MCX4745544.1 DUF397 domain-containing protein [Kitasatospora sp. NBC_01287]